MLFCGLKGGDVDAVKDALKGMGKTADEGTLSVNGRNWGDVEIRGPALGFKVDGHYAFRVSLPDVSGVQGVGKSDVMLQFLPDDNDGPEDVLTEMTFHVPDGAEDVPGFADAQEEAAAEAENAREAQANGGGEEGGEENGGEVEVQRVPPSVALMRVLQAHASVEDTASAEALMTFENVSLIVPRGKFDLELHSGLLKLAGTGQDFVVRYGSIQRIFILPKTATPHTVVAITLDPPIRKGNTYYPHLLCQFDSTEHLEDEELNIDDELFEQKKEKCGGKLERKYTGLAFDVFAKALRGLANSKLVRPGAFRSQQGGAHAVKCSYGADNGMLFPLERAFFYIAKPPILVPFTDVRGIHYGRKDKDGANVLSSTKTFDVTVSTADAEHTFHTIDRAEWHNLLDFIEAKQLPVDNLPQAKAGPRAGGRQGLNLDEPDHMAFMQDGGSSEDDSDFEMASGDGDDDEDVSMEEEDVIGSAKKKKKKEEKEPREKKEKKETKKRAKKDGDEAGEAGASQPTPTKKRKQPKKKRDADAPRKPLTAFILFSNARRPALREEFPDMPIPDIGRKIGELWREVSAEEKEKFEGAAREDKARYEQEMREYEARRAGEAGIGVEAGAGEEAAEEKPDVAEEKPAVVKEE